MNAALAVIYVTEDQLENFYHIAEALKEATANGADLVLFPEAALTGLINNDDPAHDLPLGHSIPGPVVNDLCRLSREATVWMGIGLLERSGDRLYDTAILIDPGGEIRLQHRRIQPQWHGRRADPRVYCEGSEITTCQTPFGTFAFLICGELFDDGIMARLKAVRPDWLLFPFARCFSPDCPSGVVWERHEERLYLERVKEAGVTTLMVNYLAKEHLNGGGFGGAMVVSGDGVVIHRLPLETPGILYVEL